MVTETKAQHLRPRAEERYAEELAALSASDRDRKPPGWALSAKAVRSFILGDHKLEVRRKFFGDDALVERAIVALMSEQGLMLVGEPGTAKSMLSELLAAAISGSSMLVVQGSTGVTEDHVRYGWNYALLIAEGPSARALVASPVLEAMRLGRIVRIEELTRCPPEIQDVLISILSEKVMAIPELGEAASVYAASGFSIIGTANLRDRGVHEMSSALKRRFNFETVRPLADPQLETALIRQELDQRLGRAAVAVTFPDDVTELLVTTFQDLRRGHTRDNVPLPKPSAVMSTAEAVNVAHAAALEAAYLGDGAVGGGHIGRQLRGIIVKDNEDDVKKVRAYVDHIVKERARKSGAWSDFMGAVKSMSDG
jgi:MoxR-like ATPase